MGDAPVKPIIQLVNAAADGKQQTAMHVVQLQLQGLLFVRSSQRISQADFIAIINRIRIEAERMGNVLAAFYYIMLL